MAGFSHLARRFFTSLPPIGPSSEKRRWAEGHLTEGEVRLWRRLSAADRRHSVEVARRVQVALGPTATRPVIAAALLHDCGKIVSGLGPFRRVLATVAAMIVGREQATAWADRPRGPRRRIGLYLDHPRLGAGLLGDAGAAPLTVAWAAEHHLPPTSWTVPVEIGEALREADDD